MLVLENIFVDANSVGKLGDFDVSKDDATRATFVDVSGATVIGFSLLYLSPELERATMKSSRDVRATQASDIYAFGLTLFDVMRGSKRNSTVIDIDLLKQHEPGEIWAGSFCSVS